MGVAIYAKSLGETVVGIQNTEYTPLGITEYNASDRAFGVGIGPNSANKKDGLIVYKDGTLAFNKLTAAPTTTTDRFYVLNNKLNYNGAEVGGASELQKITEGGKTGHRILGRDPLNYGDIGEGAIDLSLATFASTTIGALGLSSIAMGQNTTASANQSTAMGIGTTASGGQSTAMGQNTTASGSVSTAMGSSTTASGSVSTAMGSSTTASGSVSTAMGLGTIAVGSTSTAIGSSTTASGSASTAMGSSTTASGSASTAMGFATTARSYAEVTIGQYNDEITGPNATTWGADKNRVFSVGTGTSVSNKKTGFVIQQNGRVGIGTNNTELTKAILEVNGHVNYNGGNFGWFNSGGNSGQFSGASDYSIWASGRIGANEFNAFSDARIKNIVGASSNTNDLNTLSKIRITDYTMKDKVQYGDKAYKKVIAQELKDVYPQAVNMSKNTIPNIYQKATATNGWIALTTDLVIGDKVRIITTNSTTELIVEDIANGQFKVCTPDGEVFVYGKEVNDFHTVDYEALSTLNISATQALLKRIEELEAKNANLTSQVKEMASLKSDIEIIKAQLGLDTKSTVSNK